MKKLKDKIINNKKYILGIITGILISGTTVYAATVISASNVSYLNTSSKLSSTDVQSAIDELYTKAKTNCPDGYICKTTQFSKDSWETIANNVKSGAISNYVVGDEKEIDLGDFGKHIVRISNTSECTNGETSETACGFVIEFTDIINNQKMNSSNTNVGGWPATEIRTYLNETIYNALPSSLQNVITVTNVISSHGKTEGENNFKSTDKLYLLSTKEIWGKTDTTNAIGADTAENETKQLDYYKNKGVSTANYSDVIKKYQEKNASWWLRSGYSYSTYNFFSVYSDGNWANTNATTSTGISPAFRIA